MSVILGVLLIIVLLIPLWALFGSSETAVKESERRRSDDISPDKKNISSSEKDREIVDETDSVLKESAPRRRRSDKVKETDSVIEIDNDFSLPYPYDSIIPEDSPFELYEKTLENAEKYVLKGDFNTAKQLYEGLKRRISDPEIREKIEENLDYLNNYRQISSKKTEEKKKKTTESSHNEIKVSVDSKDFMPDNIKIDITPPKDMPSLEVDSIVSKITDKIREIYDRPASDNKELSRELEDLKSEINDFYQVRNDIIKLKEKKLEEDYESLKKLEKVADGSYQSDLKDIKNQLSDLKRDNQLARGESLFRESSDLKNEISSLKNDLQKLIGEGSPGLEGVQQLTELKEKLSKLSEKEGMYSEIVASENKLLRDKIAKLEKNLSEFSSDDSRFSQHEKELQALREELSRINDEKRAQELAGNKLSLYENEIKHLREELKNIFQEKDLSSHKNEETERLKDEISLLRQELAKISTEKDERPERSSEIEALKSKIAELSEKDNRLTESLSQENNLLREKISQLESSLEIPSKQVSDEMLILKNEIERLKNERAASSDLMSRENDLLKNELDLLKKLQSQQSSEEKSPEISDLSKTSASRKEETPTIEKGISDLKKDIEEISRENREIDRLDKKLEDLINQGQAGLTPDGRKEINDLKDDISLLKKSLLDMNNSKKQERDYEDEFAGLSEDEMVMKKILDSMDNAKRSKQDTSFDQTITKTEKTKKDDDNDEEFEFIRDMVKGKKYNEPSEDEVLEKILKDTAKEKNKEKDDFEVKGDKKEDSYDNFDINRLFDRPKQSDLDEEEFYSKFMEKYKPPVKKELPILNVSYKFDKLPETGALSKEEAVIDRTFYKYKPMLEKANDLIKRKKIKDAMNYYEVILNQDIPDEFKIMLNKNIKDLKEYMEKYINS